MHHRTRTRAARVAALAASAALFVSCSAAASPAATGSPAPATPAATSPAGTAAGSAAPGGAPVASPDPRPIPPPTKVPIGPSPSAGADGLDGRTFLSISVDGHDLVPGTTLRLAFANGSLSVNAGCNSMGGAYTISGNRLTVGQMMSTEMACEPALMAQDQWISTFLGAGPTFALAGPNLDLTEGSTTIHLKDRTVADPDRPLEGTKWLVDGIVSAGAVSSIPAGVTASLVIHDGRADVEAGCNSGSAPVTIDADTLEFGPLGLTKKLCPPEAMAVEHAVTATLTGTVQYRIEADVLMLNGGTTGLTLRAAP